MPESKTQCGCQSCGCDEVENHQETKPSRFPWLSSRLGRAATKGVGGSAITAIIFAPCPCCGGVLVACLRGLLSAGIGLLVGVFAYKRQLARADADQTIHLSNPALEAE